MSPSGHKSKGEGFRGDVFISYANEDKDEIARPLAEDLRGRGLGVWFDEFVLEVGDSLRESIEEGLARAEFGVVILSPNFFAKSWTKLELNALVARETSAEREVILPVWHLVDREAVADFSLILADRFALKTSEGLAVLAEGIATSISRGREPLSATERIKVPKQKPTIEDPAAEGKYRFEWHPTVHELARECRLCWLRVRYSGSILPSIEEHQIASLASSLHSGAYSFNELLGYFDGLMRLWVPKETSLSGAADAVQENLRRGATVEIFEVEEILRDWIWHSELDLATIREGSESLEKIAPRTTIEALGNKNLEQVDLDQLLDDRLLSRVATPSRGFRFFTAIRQGTVDGAPLPAPLRRRLESELESAVDRAVGVDEPALFRGHGFADFLITGRVADASQVSRLHTNLNAPINEAVSLTGGRAETMIDSRPDSLCFRDVPRLR